jgi:hypothetical protein
LALKSNIRLEGVYMRHILKVAAAAVVLAFGAHAAANGKVTATSGPADQVLVIRDGKTFSLTNGAELQNGDVVFTNTKGGLQLSFSGCTKSLTGGQSLVIGPDVCRAAVTTISSGQVVGGVTIGGGAGIGGGTIIAGVLGAGALGGALSGAGGNSTPSSP